jgi:D-alanine-D-alanine ligase
VDVAFITLHGTFGEDGTLQRMLEDSGLAYTGSGPEASTCAFDKIAAKRFASIAGLATPSTIALQDLEPALATYKKLVAKPARDGSSYGLIFINSVRDADAARAAARTEEYLVENCISGVEATCGVLELVDGSLTALPVIEIVPANGTFAMLLNIWHQRPKRFVPPDLLRISMHSSCIRLY